MNTQENFKNAETKPDGYIVLADGFRSKIEQRKFAKLLSFATIYHQDPDWENGVYEMTKDFAENEVRKLKIPDGWQSCGSYEILKQWFFQACR